MLAAREYSFWLYIIGSVHDRVLYIGVTNSLSRRVSEHRNSRIDGFTAKYRCRKLLYYEQYDDIRDAIARETQTKKWSRTKKKALIARLNPDWSDLVHSCSAKSRRCLDFARHDSRAAAMTVPPSQWYISRGGCHSESRGRGKQCADDASLDMTAVPRRRHRRGGGDSPAAPCRAVAWRWYIARGNCHSERSRGIFVLTVLRLT